MRDSQVNIRSRNDAWEVPKTLPTLGEQEVHVWFWTLDLAEPDLKLASAFVDDTERARAGRFHFEVDRNRFISGRAIVRLVLAAHLGTDEALVRFRYGSAGKPELAFPWDASGLRFNLAHCQGLALLAVVRDARIGVDLERVRAFSDADDLVREFFSDREAAAYARLPESERPQAFFHLWTRKEAWLKATGEGIAHSLRQVEVSFLPGEEARLIALPGGDRNEWRLRHLAPADGFVGAVAVALPECRIRTLRGESLLRSALRRVGAPPTGRSEFGGEARAEVSQ